MRLRSELKTAQAAIPAAPPKKIVVDDTEPAKKPAAKKKAADEAGDWHQAATGSRRVRQRGR